MRKSNGAKAVNTVPQGGEEHMVGMAVLGDKDEILVWAGERYLRVGMVYRTGFIRD